MQAGRPPSHPIYPTKFQSKFGPKYHYQPSVFGLNFKQLSRVGIRAAGLGGSLFFAVIFYASGVPRLRRDVLENVPLLGGLFRKEAPPPSDNPF